MRRATIAALCVLALALSACSGDTTTSTPPGNAAGFALQVASSDSYVGTPQRVQVGIVGQTEEGTVLITGGTIPVSLLPPGGGQPIEGKATYVPAPGTPSSTSPDLTPPSEARGVYQLDDIDFPSAGTWQAKVSLTANGQRLDLTDAFEVAEKPSLPAPGDRAIPSENLTMASKDVNPQAIDSRAQDGAAVPDPELHQDTIAAALQAGRPILALFATPVYCASQFCGPTTDALEKIAATGPGDAAYIHVEIWNNNQKQVVNKAAAQWLYRNGDLTEPWLFLIAPDGTIVDRWGPLFDPAEVRAELDEVAR